MNATLRPYATTGVALVGAAMVAVTPVAAKLAGLPDAHVATVKLTGLEDVSSDFGQLLDNFLLAPGVGTQQGIVDLVDNLKTLDFSGLLTNLEQTFSAATLFPVPFIEPDATFELAASWALIHTLNGPHMALIGALGEPVPDRILTDPLLQFAASPLSAVVMGFAGPFLSPVADIVDAVESLFSADFSGALDYLLAAPGSILTGADLNLDLTPLVSGLLPDGAEVTTYLALGGIFSPGASNAGTLPLLLPGEAPDQNFTGLGGTYLDIDGNKITAVGGSLLNEVGVEVKTPILNTGVLETGVAGVGVGPIGAVETLQQAIGAALGMDWDGRLGLFRPVIATAPLIGLSPFDISGLESLFDPAASSAAVGDGLSGLVNGLADLAFNGVL